MLAATRRHGAARKTHAAQVADKERVDVSRRCGTGETMSADEIPREHNARNSRVLTRRPLHIDCAPVTDLTELNPSTRLLFVQYGDYLEAAVRFAEGGGETYAAQRYTVDFVGELAKRLERVTVLTFSRDYPLQQAPNGVYCEGVELYPTGRRSRHLELIRAAAAEQPSHMIVVAPLLPLISWGLASRKQVLPLFADSFHAEGLKERVKAKALAWTLNRRAIDWVSNHNLAASLDLQRIGVSPEKILPFDWPAEVVRSDLPPKTAPRRRAFRLIYVGTMIASKGVGDAIHAVAALRESGREVELSLVGSESEEFRTLVDELGLGSSVRFLGRQPHDRIVPLMNEHDAVLIPSRHEYPEGLPMTIFEGLCSRSPVIVSDHPMFAIRMRNGENCLTFEASSPLSLANSIQD